MKSLMWLTESILLDCGMKCGADTARDINTVKRRTEAEGDSFLTITLPAFCSAFDRALAEGRLDPASACHFKWHRRGLPVFLRGFLVKIFSLDGNLLPEPCKESISCVRQVLLLHKKILRECDETRSRAAMQKYKECENEVARQDTDPDLRSEFRAVSRVLWSSLVGNLPFGDPRPELHPAHGPGATADRIRGNSKYEIKQWHSRLESVFPYTEFGIASVRNYGDESSYDVRLIEPEDEQPVRVVFVPKTQKTPRVIAIEPVCMQYMQQGLLRWLVPLIERNEYTGGRVNFSRQDINASLALSSSHDQRFATLDLSEASDRVSAEHVADMLHSIPCLWELVFACRSTRAELPDGETLILSKFASMGSALCFPMEAMVFFTIIVTGRLRRLRLPPTAQNIRKVSSELYIYGDDILVPSDEAPSVRDDLHSFGLKVNTAKSFWTGKFRESCGMDAYDGVDVTPTYMRHECPADRRDAEAIVSWTSTANQLYMKGYWGTVRKIREHINRVTGGLPHLGTTAQGLGWNSYSNETQFSRWNKELMRLEVRTLVPSSAKIDDPLDGDAALLKCLAIIGSKEPTDPDHLLRSVARGRLTLKRRWVPSL